MNYDQVRDLLVTQWTYTGGPNEAKASEFYHDDALLEFPSRASGSRARALHRLAPAVPGQARVRAAGAAGRRRPWVAETGLRYDGGEPLSVVKILQFRGDKIERETLYFAEPFPAPDWRRPWAAEGDPEDRRRPPGLRFRRELDAVDAEAGP